MEMMASAAISPRGEDSTSDINLYLNNLPHRINFLYKDCFIPEPN